MAAEAAAAPKPSPTRRDGMGQETTSKATRVAAQVVESAERTTDQVRQASAGVARGSKRFGEAAWGPFARLSGALWLEVMGVFFGLFVLTAGINVWKLHENLHDIGSNHVQHQRLLFSIAMLAIFGYFCVSSFVRAARKSRGK